MSDRPYIKTTASSKTDLKEAIRHCKKTVKRWLNPNWMPADSRECEHSKVCGENCDSLTCGGKPPEAWAAADEHTMDENPEYMQNEVKKLKSAGDLYENHAIVRVSVPDSDIDRALCPTATGKVLGG